MPLKVGGVAHGSGAKPMRCRADSWQRHEQSRQGPSTPITVSSQPQQSSRWPRSISRPSGPQPVMGYRYVVIWAHFLGGGGPAPVATDQPHSVSNARPCDAQMCASCTPGLSWCRGWPGPSTSRAWPPFTVGHEVHHRGRIHATRSSASRRSRGMVTTRPILTGSSFPSSMSRRRVLTLIWR